MRRFDTKDPGENTVLTFDFTKALSPGESLTGAITVAVSMFLGADATPAALLNGTAAFDGTQSMVLVPVQGGVEGADYTIKVTTDTTNPKKRLAMSGVLPVRTE